ncbi:flagellar basal body P-ring formation chaperone FlgA [Cronobacter dublinensis]|uniref:flagellar basal body P-ring formation chaperone FlgA n=1 Tax=Cronobacter dublinensis TaxID=413497 RepID=UPI000CFB9A70|nr:flagellar basal body P-ring formation chaperone FlgA [Cronobacter dublinensis]EKY3221921.1 flagellar basal body P-ring formation protein FlgA [Cronobacter dublinensis]ELY4511915.1 flagellar basal body P-ring formation protein FlgA [Cronobacter dublinensis]MDI7504772.1 flagellar basal body P-ring formation chaperone FlgA [Cronobacter dublinensis]
MKSLKFCLAAGLLLLSPGLFADMLNAQLTPFFLQRLAGMSDAVVVTVKTPEPQRLTCDNPDFSLPGNARLWGNLSVQVRCGDQKRYMQVNVQAFGNYVVASQPVARGGMLDESNVRLERGRLDLLPPKAMLNLDQAREAVTLRDLAPNQPIMLTMVRQSWRVKAGQQVQIIANGEGFSINGEGRALNNAAVAQNARVRMASGQVVSGIVGSDGIILINL